MNNQPINIDYVIQLVKTLYNSNNPNEQNEANRRLNEIQASQEAWQVCWLILDSPQAHCNEVYFFAANLLVLKINQSWAQQDEEWLEKHLRPKLLETLLNHAASPTSTKLVIERLALALANFSLHSIPRFWFNAIEEIVQTLTDPQMTNKIPQQRICDILLKILTYIPEEFSIMLPDPKHRTTLNGQMTQSALTVYKFLHSLLTDDNPTTENRQDTLKCLTSWILHSETSLLELEDCKSFLNLIYDLILDDELCASSCTALAAIFDSRKAEKYRNAVIDFMTKLASLKPVIDKYILQDESECVIKIYSLIINFCENHSRLMVKLVLEDDIVLEPSTKEVTKESIFTLIKLIIDCTAAPGTFGMDEKYSEITLPFWFSFFETFYYYHESHMDLICDLFDPLVDSLMQILVKKAQYPSSYTYKEVWNDDQREDYRRYRHDLGDVLSVLVQFPRAKDRVFQLLHDQLVQELVQFIQRVQSRKISDEITDEMPWQNLETLIFSLKSISEAVPYDEEKVIPKVFQVLAQIPYENCETAELYCTSAEMLAAYSDWLYTHPDYISIALRILFLGVTAPNNYVRLMSTMSLKDITTECQAVIAPYAQDIVTACLDAIIVHDSSLATQEKSRLMHTFGCAVVMAPQQAIIDSVSKLTTPLLNDLSAKVQLDLSINPSCRSVILDRLCMLNSLIESLHIKQYSGNQYEDADENNIHLLIISKNYPDQDLDSETLGQPVVLLLKQLSPILNAIVDKYRSDEEVISKVSETVRKAAKNLSLEIKPVLKDLMAIMINAYDPLLNFTTIQDTVPFYNIFKVDKEVHDFLRDAFATITEKTLDYCMRNSLRQLSVTVEVYFRFAHLICKKYFSFLSEEPCRINVNLLYKLALASLELPEKKTLVEVCNFLSLFCVKSLGESHLHAIFIDHLDVLLTNIFNILGGNYSTPKNAIDCVTDMAFLVFDSKEAKPILNQIELRNDFPTCHITREEKARYIRMLIQEAAAKNRRKFKEISQEFVFRVRNLIRAT